MKIIPISIVIPIRPELDKSPGTLRVWMQERRSSDELNGALEFAGGKIEANESPLKAALRELQEETGVTLTKDSLIPFSVYDHTYQLKDKTTKTVQLHAFICEDPKATFAEDGWFKVSSVWREEFAGKIPSANYRIFEDLVKEFL